MLPQPFNPTTVENLKELIAQKTGIYIRDRDWKYLETKLRDRVKHLGVSSLESYYQRLNTKGQASQQEWQALVLLITNNESYFFRDKGQFTLLRERIFPHLIQEKRRENNLSLRLWSAGCSTGEEPYSLAILIQELIPDWYRWNIEVIGTDINWTALQKAREACFNAWSFRSVSPKIQEKYFYQINSGYWQLNALSRSWVKFELGNLLEDHFPNPLVHDLDLIVCRNVFVYFHLTAIGIVLSKFYKSLRPGGYLLTGHAEVQGQDLQNFQVKVFPESMIYQRPDFHSQVIPRVTKVSPPIPLPSPIPKPQKVPKLPFQPVLKSDYTQQLLSDARQHFQRKEYPQAIQTVEEILKGNPRHFQGIYLLAQIHGNLGQYTQAKDYCQRAIQIDSLAAEPYYLLAKVAEEEQDLERAKTLLKTVIYLKPDAVSAYLELSHLYNLEGQDHKAEKMLLSALAELQELSPQQPVQWQENLTAQVLIDQIEKILKNKYLYEDI